MDFERQQNQLRLFCESNNYEIVAEFAEKISGAKKIEERKIFTDCIKFILNPQNNIHGLVVHEISRISRSVAISAQAIENLHSAGIWIYSLKDNLYTLNEDGKVNSNANLIITFLQALAQNELETLKYRVESGLNQSIYVNKNAFGGVAPFGYKRVNKKFVIVEEEANIIKEIFDLYLNGNMGCMQIAMYLNQKGTKTRLQTINKTFKLKNTVVAPDKIKWSDGVVNKLLKNRLYTGVRIHKGVNEIELPECKIIDLDIYNAVQDKLKSNYNKKGINTKFEYLIDSTKIKCGECGLSYFPHKRINGRDNAYKCLSKRYNYKDEKTCTNNSININKLSRIIWKYVLSTDAIIKQFEKNKENNIYITQLKEKENEIKSKSKELAKITKFENEILDLLLEKTISKVVYTQRFRNIQLQKNTLEYQIKKINEEISELKVFIEDINDFDKQLRTMKASGENMREPTNKIVNKVVIHKVKGDFKFTDAKSDVCNVIEIQNKSGNSMFYLISKWSKNYVRLDEGDFVNGEIVCSINKIKKHQREIPTRIKI